MPAPKNYDEALERASKMSDEGLAAQLALGALDTLKVISELAVVDLHNLSANSGYQGTIDLTEISEQEDSCIRSVRIISRMVSDHEGLCELALVTQLLLNMTRSSKAKNKRNALELFAWTNVGELSFGDKLAKFGSMVNQVFPAIERASRTPIKHMSEVRELITSGGGMKYLASCFSGTPAETVLKVVAKSLIASQEFEEQAQKVKRSKIDVQKATIGHQHSISTRTRSSIDHLKKFNEAQEKYYDLQAQISTIKDLADPEKMAQLSKLSKECALAFAEYQRWIVFVQTNPTRVEEARMSFLNGMSATDAYAYNQARLENMSIQFRQNAMSRLFQMVIVLTTISTRYCDRFLAINRKMQLEIIDSCKKTLASVARGKYEDMVGGSELCVAALPA